MERKDSYTFLDSQLVMDEKTAELRDIIMEVTDDGTVTENQEESRGTLTEDEREIEEKLRATIERMRSKISFQTDLSVDELVSVVRGFYNGDRDTEIAVELGCSENTVVQARLDLHLIRDSEINGSFDIDTLRELLADQTPVSEIAATMGVEELIVKEYTRIVRTQSEIRRVNGMYTDKFEELLTDADLEEHTEDVTDDGLDEATEGMESNVSF